MTSEIEAGQLEQILYMLHDIVEEAIDNDTFKDETSYERLPLPWLAKKMGVSIQEAKDLELQKLAYLAYTNLNP